MRLRLIGSLLVAACNASMDTPKPNQPTPEPSLMGQNTANALRFTKAGVGSFSANLTWTEERVTKELPGHTLTIVRGVTPEGYPWEDWKLMRGEILVADLLPHDGQLLSADVYEGEVEGARVKPGDSANLLLRESLSCQNLGRSDGALVCADDVPPPPYVVAARPISYWIATEGRTPPRGRFSPELIRGMKVTWIGISFDGALFPAPPADKTEKATWAMELIRWETLNRFWIGMAPDEIQRMIEGDVVTKGKEELQGLGCETIESTELGYKLWIAEAGEWAGKVVAVEVWLVDEEMVSLVTQRGVTLGAPLLKAASLYADLGALQTSKEVRLGAGEGWISFRTKDGATVERIFLGRASEEWLDKRP